MFSTRYSTFVYADWNVAPDDFRSDATKTPIPGFELLAVEDVPLCALIPAGWRSAYENDRRAPATGRCVPADPFSIKACTKATWRRLIGQPDAVGRDSLDLYFFSGEATLVFEVLYARMKVNPAAIAIVQPGGGLGPAVWTTLDGADTFFHQLVRKSSPAMPESLLLGGQGQSELSLRQMRSPWPEYGPGPCRTRTWTFRGISELRGQVERGVAEFRLRAHSS